MTRLDPQPWMTAPSAVKLMTTLGEARFVGGAVRNALLGQPVSDVDVATPHVPQKVCELLQKAGIKTVPTGIEHGTITAVVDGKPYEVTTLRRDVETDGRRAVVAFTTDWAEDAQRRDFTMNALYASADGEILDTVGGVADLKEGRVRFVGDPATRIREDYLRILRLFRFHAWYGKDELDKPALEAASAPEAIEGLVRNVSGERIRNEMFKLLLAPSPAQILQRMDQKSILYAIMKYDFHSTLEFDRLNNLINIEKQNNLAPDPLLRLGALIPNDPSEADYISEEWSLSNAQSDRLKQLTVIETKITPSVAKEDMHKLIYRLHRSVFRDQLFLRWAEQPDRSKKWAELFQEWVTWHRPQFPLTGADVMVKGVPQGPKVGEILQRVETWWIEHDFPNDRAALDNKLQEVIEAVG